MILEISILLLLGDETRHDLDAGGHGLKVQIGKIKPRKKLIIQGQNLFFKFFGIWDLRLFYADQNSQLVCGSFFSMGHQPSVIVVNLTSSS